MTTTDKSGDLHRALLARLLSLRPKLVRRVRLVARLYNDKLLGGDSTRRVFVFVPDLHLMSATGDERFRYGFRRINKSVWLRRDLLLDGVCEALLAFWNEDLPTGVALRTVQLGDFVDLWREKRVLDEDVTGMVARILADSKVAQRRLIRSTSDSLEADMLVGNHDLRASKSTDLARARRAFVYGMNNLRSLMATHGDLFDELEEWLNDKIQDWMVENFAEGVGGSVYPADRSRLHVPGELTGAQGSRSVVVDSVEDDALFQDWVNVWVTRAGMPKSELEKSHGLLPRALKWAKSLRAGNKKELNRLGLESALPDLRTIVVGHSHQARICVHRDPVDPANDLCLFDCGAWLEEMHFGKRKNDDRVASCTLGVLTGGDARIYQLDPAEALFMNSRGE